MLDTLTATNVLISVFVALQVAAYAVLGYNYYKNTRPRPKPNLDDLSYEVPMIMNNIAESQHTTNVVHPDWSMRVDAIYTLNHAERNVDHYYVSSLAADEILKLFNEGNIDIPYIQKIVDTVHNTRGFGGRKMICLEPHGDDHHLWWNNVVEMVKNDNVEEARGLVSRYRDLITTRTAESDD